MQAVIMASQKQGLDDHNTNAKGHTTYLQTQTKGPKKRVRGQSMCLVKSHNTTGPRMILLGRIELQAKWGGGWGHCNEDIKMGLLRLGSITNRGPQKAILLTN